MQREHGSDGTVTETKTMTFSEKKTYRQDLPMYNLAQIEEKSRMQRLLFDLCCGLEEPPQYKGGRCRTPIGDMIFAVVLKGYSTLSSRRNGADLAAAHEKGYLSTKLHPMMVNTFLESQLLTPILQQLIVQSSLPLRAVETVFAPDSTLALFPGEAGVVSFRLPARGAVR